jgi:hypothetical protein
VFEHGGSSKVPVVDLSSSSDEEGLIPDTSQDEELTRRLFGHLNLAILRPPGDDKVIILSDSDEEEVREEDATDAEGVSSSVVKSLAPTASTDDANDADKGCSRDQAIGGSSSGRD